MNSAADAVPRQLPAWNSAATQDAIRHFALGVGDDNPLWWDRGYAEASVWERMFAPPTFIATAANGGYPISAAYSSRRGRDQESGDTSGIWVEDDWAWSRHLWLNESVQAFEEDAHSEPVETARHGSAQVESTRVIFRSGDEPSDLVAVNTRSFLRFSRSDVQQPMPAARSTYRYRADQLLAIEQHYESEAAARRGSLVRSWESVQTGDSMGGLVKGPLTMTEIIAWMLGAGSPMCRGGRIAHNARRDLPEWFTEDPELELPDCLEAAHWVPSLALKHGMRAGYDFGSQRVSWCVHLITDWMGDAGFLRKLNVRLRRPNFVGDTSWVRGEVVSTEVLPDNHDVGQCICRISVVNQEDETTATAEAVIELPRSGGVG